jgi:phenylacetate-CoA ligase
MNRWFTWNVLFRLHERLKGHATFQILQEMESADRLSTAELKSVQSERLREFIAYCYANVPYAKAQMDGTGVSPFDIAEARDLRKLPLMRKSDIRKNRDLLRSRIADSLTPFTTGGSSGEPLIFDLSKRRIASRVACRQRVSRWFGLSVGDQELALWGSPVELTQQDIVRALRDNLLHTKLLSAFEMNEETMSSYLDILEREKFKQIFAYPSAIYLLCRHAQKEGRNLRGLGIKAVFVTGEVLFPYQRELISEVLNCRVANGYGGRDSGFISHECPEGGMHILSDAVIVEIVDAKGNPVPVGEPGEVVVTDLYSHEAPFIRYATGDVAALSASSCSCGRPLELLERIEGRSNDTVLAPDGRVINSLALIYAVREIDEIQQFRIIQKRPDRFHIVIAPRIASPKAAEEQIQTGWEKLLRASIDVTFEYMETLPAERSGKFRHVISEIPSDDADWKKQTEDLTRVH